MKRISISLLLLFTLLSCNHPKEKKDAEIKNDSISATTKPESNLEYACPMHPEVVRKEPGKCPNCQMELQVRS